MAFTRTQAFLANISNLQPGKGLGRLKGRARARVFTCQNVRKRPGSF